MIGYPVTLAVLRKDIESHKKGRASTGPGIDEAGAQAR